MPGKSAHGKDENANHALKCRFHDLRHSAVTRLLEAGIPYLVVANIMGAVGGDNDSHSETHRAQRHEGCYGGLGRQRN
jgi:integrase